MCEDILFKLCVTTVVASPLPHDRDCCLVALWCVGRTPSVAATGDLPRALGGGEGVAGHLWHLRRAGPRPARRPRRLSSERRRAARPPCLALSTLLGPALQHTLVSRACWHSTYLRRLSVRSVSYSGRTHVICLVSTHTVVDVCWTCTMLVSDCCQLSLLTQTSW